MHTIIHILDKLTGDLGEFNSIERFRIRLCIGIIVSVTITILLLFLGWIIFIENKGPLGFIAFSIGCAAHIAALYLFYKSKDLARVGNIFISIIALLIFFAVTITGGLQSPAVVVLIVVPVLALLVSGTRSGIFWLVFTMTAYAAQVGFYYLDAPLPVLMRPENKIFLEIGLWMASTIIIIGVLMVFEANNTELSLQLYRDRQKFKQLSMQDALTGLNNRLYFDKLLDNLISRHSITEKGFTVIYIDLNKFKQVNDLYGHFVGDLVLKHVAECLRHSCRKDDHVIRMGGDEFSLILEGELGEKEIGDLCHKIEKNLAIPARHNDIELSVTASFGFACFPEHGKTAEEILTRADKSMYLDKRV